MLMAAARPSVEGRRFTAFKIRNRKYGIRNKKAK
jgi:hypothetical protein